MDRICPKPPDFIWRQLKITITHNTIKYQTITLKPQIANCHQKYLVSFSFVYGLFFIKIIQVMNDDAIIGGGFLFVSVS